MHECLNYLYLAHYIHIVYASEDKDLILITALCLSHSHAHAWYYYLASLKTKISMQSFSMLTHLLVMKDKDNGDSHLPGKKSYTSLSPMITAYRTETEKKNSAAVLTKTKFKYFMYLILHLLQIKFNHYLILKTKAAY